MQSTVKSQRRLIPACNADLKRLKRLLEATKDVDEIEGYILGPALCSSTTIGKVVELSKRHTSKQLICDLQPAGTGKPDSSPTNLLELGAAGLDSIITPPLTCPRVLEEWMLAANSAGLDIIARGPMEVADYQTPQTTEAQELALEKFYGYASEVGVNEFYMPSDQSRAQTVYSLLWNCEHAYVCYSRGFSIAGRACLWDEEPPCAWHAIVDVESIKPSELRRTIAIIIQYLAHDRIGWLEPPLKAVSRGAKQAK